CSRRAWSLGKVWPRHSTGSDFSAVELNESVMLVSSRSGVYYGIRRLLHGACQLVDGRFDIVQLFHDRVLWHAGAHVRAKINVGLFAVLGFCVVILSRHDKGMRIDFRVSVAFEYLEAHAKVEEQLRHGWEAVDGF